MIALALAGLLAAGVAPPGGDALYTVHCASCHGVEKWGTAEGPSLRGVGLAAVDFYLMSGRMPAAVPDLEVGDRPSGTGQRLPLEQIRAIESFLAPTVAGGPPIPPVTADGDLDHGRALFSVHCMQCHGALGTGGALGALDWAPSLRGATIDVVADAIRAGPGQMPQFGEHQLDQADLDDVASYVMRLQRSAGSEAVPPFRSTGPVPEGAIGYVAIMVLVSFVFLFWRSDTPPSRREESVRHDEGERTA